MVSWTKFLSQLQPILESPDDDELRLIFADWCDENNDARGRLIRVQLALEQVGEYDPRRVSLEREEKILISRFEPLWTHAFHGMATGFTFRKGLIDGVKMTARQFVMHGETVFRLAPIRQLDLLDAGQQTMQVFESPLLRKIRSLSLFAQHLGPGVIFEKIIQSRFLTSLQKLHLGRNQLNDQAIRLLARSPLIGQLKELILSENPITDDGLDQLLDRCMPLNSLDLSKTQVSFRGAIDLAATLTQLGSLRRLVLLGNPQLSQLSTNASSLLNVAELDVSQCEINVMTLEKLLSQQPSAIRRLTLAQNQLANAGAIRLAESKSMQELRYLDLQQNDIGDAGAEAIAKSANLRRLLECHLTFNPIQSLGWMAFLHDNALPNCRRFSIPNAGITDTLNMALQEKFQ